MDRGLDVEDRQTRSFGKATKQFSGSLRGCELSGSVGSAASGRDDVDVADLGTAVEASSAIPGWFAPVLIAGEEFVDGGGHSPTNADLAAGLGFELTIVVAPMAGGLDPIGDLTRDPLGAMRSLASGKSVGRVINRGFLAQEVELVRKRGSKVVVFEPTAEDITAIGDDGMDGTQAALVAERAYRSAAAQLEHDADDILVSFR